VQLEGLLKSIEKFDDLIRDRTCYLLACSRVSQPTTLQLASKSLLDYVILETLINIVRSLLSVNAQR
jgi:hypothetical protein